MTDARDADEPAGPGFWLAVVLGGALMAFGVRGLLDAAPATRPSQVALGFLGLDLAHDALVAPLACAVGYVLGRVLPDLVRAPVRTGLFASLVVILVGWAPLRGYGRAQVPDNPSVDPLDYGTALLTVLTIVWAAVALWIAIRWWRSSDRRAVDSRRRDTRTGAI